VRFLERSQVLDRIREHAQDKRLIAAVAYAGEGAARLVPVKAGDIVVVNGSMNALASGATSARVLRGWFEDHAQVYVHETLHAKVFVIGRTAFVGSANLSARAADDGTVEAAVESTDPTLVADAREFVRRLTDDATPVTEAWLEWAESIPVRASNLVPWSPDPPFQPNGPYDIWIGPEETVTWTDEELALAAEGRRAHRAPGGRYDIVPLSEDRDDRSRLKSPDMVVLIRPRSVLLVRFLERRRSQTAAMGFYRTDRHALRLSTAEIAKALDLSVSRLRQGWVRASVEQRAVLRDLFGLPDLPSRQG
jgi:hypothetical protein